MRTAFIALTVLLSASGLASNAWAWDPNAGADDAPVPVHYHPVQSNVLPQPSYTPMAAPQRSYAPIAAPQPAIIAPLPVVAAAPAPAPAIIAPPPAARIVPIENDYAITAPAYNAPVYAPAPVAAPIARSTYIPPSYPRPASRYKVNDFSLGAEGFWDRYREPSATVTTNSGYGALDGGWEHYYNPNWFNRTELRGSYGVSNYKSDSGTLDGNHEWEFEGRELVGYDQATGGGSHVKPYLGLDARYYRDDGKGTATNLGAGAYDRRIFQLMLPVGVTYDIPGANGYHYLPNIEGGPLLFGNVSSHLGNIPGYFNTNNQQHAGYELRGEFMVDRLNDQGQGWEFGPFVRYWHFQDSDVDHTPPAGPFGFTDWIEPENSRLQLGAKLNYKF